MSLQDYEDWMRRVYSDYAFTVLNDTPASYSGVAGYYVVVNNSETGLDFASLVLSFLGLTDTPGDYTGHGGEYTKVKADESGLEFTSPSGIPSGTRMLFKNWSAPTGWTFVAEDNDRVILNTSTEADGGKTGGGWTISGCTIDNHFLSVSEMPSHQHTDSKAGYSGYPRAFGYDSSYQSSYRNNAFDYYLKNNPLVSATGGGGSHNHGFTSDGTWRPAYVKVITCQKD